METRALKLSGNEHREEQKSNYFNGISNYRVEALAGIYRIHSLAPLWNLTRSTISTFQEHLIFH